MEVQPHETLISANAQQSRLGNDNFSLWENPSKLSSISYPED